MTKHTPGPWSAERDPGHYDTLSTVVGGASGKDRKAYGLPRELMVQVGGFANVEAQEANARLIAAAPDLLAASQSLLDHYVELASSGDAGYWDPEREDQVIAMRAAIAKATGEPVNAQ